ncbi:hypothetical protein QBC34DRAFT_380446 [Podospora aff. communis PSN243]|uniref:Uncharacterized protein n=1 Tax=Podospora aff. communis PSN243 TaxID=3040156 RepID=A0AAV9GLA7_9PEZI|nr:hypothetical protein QBC34DRAFT_380446 [Podospora aff. communis PSN243]
MKSLAAILLAGGTMVSPVLGAEQKHLSGIPPHVVRRPFMSCKETYGDSWIPCGDEKSPYCYSPALGQSCCETDDGYCDAGTRCAPVAGHCCLDHEDLTSCARNAGFELPAEALVTPADGLRGPVNVQTPFRGGGFNNSRTLGTNVSSADRTPQSTSDSKSPYVQVSVARQHRGTLAWMAAGMGAVGLFMFSC